MPERLYRLIAINDKTGKREQQTVQPMTHHECCVMKSKQSDGSKRHGVRFMLVQVKFEGHDADGMAVYSGVQL
jgi:hypothetical protein